MSDPAALRLPVRIEGLVFNIQRFSVHDGPGIRDLVFLKGCPLNCRWCSNPESQDARPAIAYNAERCIGRDVCGRCLPACPEGAIHAEGGKIGIARDLCTQCGKCVEACPAGALKLFGQPMSVEEVVRIAEEDSVFYTRSSGGITVSGGEPCQQSHFVEDLLRTCRESGIGTSVETTGHAKWEALERVSRYADTVIYDVKSIDSSKHRAFTGVPNTLILENLGRLASAFPDTPIVARTPVVPGFNDTVADIEAIVEFLRTVPTVKSYELLAYHRFGEGKYAQLGRRYPMCAVRPPPEEQMRELRSVAARFG